VGLDGDAPGGGAVVDTRPVVTFRYRAGDPRPNAVSVAGSFNGDDAGATVLSDDDGDGVWEARVRLEPGRYTVQFVLDGRTWLSAGRGRKREPDGFGGYRSVFEVGEDPVTVEGPPR